MGVDVVMERAMAFSLLLAASFALCDHGPRINCVVDGDTFWLMGEKVRIADINTPEISRPGCRGEAELARQAQLRLVELLNEGPFVLEPIARDTDRYGRKLRVITRRGRSIGDRLVAEGLAEPWRGRCGAWC